MSRTSVAAVSGFLGDGVFRKHPFMVVLPHFRIDFSPDVRRGLVNLGSTARTFISSLSTLPGIIDRVKWTRTFGAIRVPTCQPFKEKLDLRLHRFRDDYAGHDVYL